MTESKDNASKVSSAHLKMTTAPERKKLAPRTTSERLPWLTHKSARSVTATLTDGQNSTAVESSCSSPIDDHQSPAQSPSTIRPSGRKVFVTGASTPAITSKPMARHNRLVQAAERRLSPAVPSSPSPVTRHRLSQARRASLAIDAVTPLRAARASTSQLHESQKRRSIVHVKKDDEEPEHSDLYEPRPRTDSLAPVPDHLQQPSTSDSSSTPPATVSGVNISPNQPAPIPSTFVGVMDRSINNMVEGLEAMVQEAVEVAEVADDRSQVKELCTIIEGAKGAVHDASPEPGFLMTTALPLKVSDSSSSSSRHQNLQPSAIVQRGGIDDVAPNLRLPQDVPRASVSYDWAYANPGVRKQDGSSTSLCSSSDHESERDHVDFVTRSDLLLPKLAQTAPREHVDFVLRPVGRDKSRGRSHQRITDNIAVRRNRRCRSHEHTSRPKTRLGPRDDSGFGEGDTSLDEDDRLSKPYGTELTVRGQSHHHTFGLRRHHRRQPIARNWSAGKKRLTASIACINTALLGVIVGIYAGEVPRIQYSLADERHVTIIGNAVLYAGLAFSTFFAWTLPLLHGRKPYVLAALAIALPLQFPQAIVVSGFRNKDAKYRVGLLLSRGLSGVVLGFANVNYITVLLDLFGASLQSKNPHQEFVVANDVRRHGGGMGMWLGLWSWCWIGSLAVGFQIGAAIIEKLTPDWGFYIVVVILALALILNIMTSETRRAPFRKSVTEVYDRDENYITRRVSRGEVKLHIETEGPKYWFEEVWAGMQLMAMMLCQPGFLVLALYLGWIYAQVVLVIILLGALLSRDYRWKPTKVGAGVISIAIGALLAIPLTKAGIFSRERKSAFRTDSMTFQKQVTWSSHLVRRAIFTLTLPLMGMAYTVSSARRPQPWLVPIAFAGAVGFLSILAIAECHGLMMETFDTCDLQPGVNTRHRLQSMAVQDRRRRTNYTSFPRVTAGIFASQIIAFILAAVATIVGGSMTRNLGAQKSTGTTAGILFALTVLLILVLCRFKSVQVIPNHTFGTRRDTAAWQEFKDLEKVGRGSDWKAVVIGNPSGKMRRMSVLELGALSRWTEIRKLNFLIKGVMLGQAKEKKDMGDGW